MQKRSFKTVCRDDLYPGDPMSPNPEMEGMRYRAIAEVLTAMPDEDYETYKTKVNTVYWYIPGTWCRAEVQPVHATIFPEDKGGAELQDLPYAAMIYLAPKLEDAAWDIVVAVVAHELAHIILGHNLVAPVDVCERQEDEAWQRITDWGFGKEARKHNRICRAIDTRTETLNKRL